MMMILPWLSLSENSAISTGMLRYIKILFIAKLILISFANSQETIPNIRLKMLNGKYAKLYDYLKNGPMILDFWATWCEPCKKQMKFLNTFHNHYKETGFKVLTINTDTPKSISKVKSYIRTKDFVFHVAVDPNSQVKNKLKIKLMPTTLIIDQDGTIVYRHQGYLPGDELKVLEALNGLLDKKGIQYSELNLDIEQTKGKKEGIKVDF
tara:strand:- start:3050 stop:3676 length:627 start_codon:yes stop_codon:yes gene_type:complete